MFIISPLLRASSLASEKSNHSVVQPPIAARCQPRLPTRSTDVATHCLSDGTAGEEQNLAYNVEQSAVDA